LTTLLLQQMRETERETTIVEAKNRMYRDGVH